MHLKNITRNILGICCYSTMMVLSLLKLNPKKIVVMNFNGKGYGDSPKYIIEELLKRDSSYEIMWIVKNLDTDICESFPKSINLVKYNSISSFFHLATAKIWIDNCRKSRFIRKRNEQFYIQLWHGAPALKKIESDAINSLSKSYIKDAKSDSKKINLFISNCGWFTNLIPSTFWYEGVIVETGLPRNDIYFNSVNIKTKIYNHFKIPEETKIILYAPTFRTVYSTEVYDIDFENIIRELKKTTSETWVVIIKLHPNITQYAKDMKYSDYILNGSNYADLQELTVAADILITDYSSVMFDFSITKKPVFLYWNDYQQYKSDRNFYFDENELPYDVSYSNEELLNNIKSFNQEKYYLNLNNFFNEIKLVETGESAEKVTEIILKLEETTIKK